MKPLSRSIVLSAGGLAITLLAGCRHSDGNNRNAPPSPPPMAVHVQRVEKKERPATEEVVGTVRAKLQAVIEAKISGKIEKMLVAPGQKVAAGDLLVALDAGDVQARAGQARAVSQQAEADWKRFSALWDQKVVSQAEYDTAKSKWRVAEASLLEAETLLGYAKIAAPFEGVITRKLADVGDLAAPGKPLLEMEDTRALRLEADVPEAVVNYLKIGDQLPVRVGALDPGFSGVVSEIAPAADPNSRTFLVKLDLPAAPGLRAGQFGRVLMPVGETSALRVPAAAVVQRGQMELIFVASNGHAQLRLVKTGKPVGDEVEIVSGLDTEEFVVTTGAGQLEDGQSLSIQ
jgi:RND family efflux transporter MFP subunit